MFEVAHNLIRHARGASHSLWSVGIGPGSSCGCLLSATMVVSCGCLLLPILHVHLTALPVRRTTRTLL
jgi:hypothetical protein